MSPGLGCWSESSGRSSGVSGVSHLQWNSQDQSMWAINACHWRKKILRRKCFVVTVAKWFCQFFWAFCAWTSVYKSNEKWDMVLYLKYNFPQVVFFMYLGWINHFDIGYLCICICVCIFICILLFSSICSPFVGQVDHFGDCDIDSLAPLKLWGNWAEAEGDLIRQLFLFFTFPISIFSGDQKSEGDLS